MNYARDRLGRHVRAAICALATVMGFAGTAGAADDTAAAPAAKVDVKMDTAGSAPEAVQLDDGGNPANYEFAFVSAGTYQTWGLAGRTLFFGAGGGLGPPLYRYSKFCSEDITAKECGNRKPGWDNSLEVVYGNLFLRVSPVPYVDIDVGPKIAIVSALFDVKDAPQSGFSMGGYVDLRVGTKKIKVGPRFAYDRVAYYDYYESGWRLTPLMLRVVH